MKPKVFVTRRLPGNAVERLAQAAVIDLWPDPLPPSHDELVRHVADAEGLLCMLTDRVDEALLRSAAGLRVISQMAAGYDNIDLRAAAARGIPVGYTPGVLTEATADLTLALMLALARRLPEAEQVVREGRWRTWEPAALLGVELGEATLGIVGFGKIGQAVARRARGFGTKVVFANRSPCETDLGRQVPLDELLGTSDIVSLHVPLTPQTERLIGERELSLMKPSALLVNTARGKVLDQAALVRALEQGRIAGAGLDVALVEPIPEQDPLLRAPRCLLLPHIGSATFSTRARMADMAVDNCLAGLRREPLPHAVTALAASTPGQRDDR